MDSLKSYQIILINIPFSLSPNPLSEKSLLQVCDCSQKEQLVGREDGGRNRQDPEKIHRSQMKGFGLEVGGES